MKIICLFLFFLFFVIHKIYSQTSKIFYTQIFNKGIPNYDYNSREMKSSILNFINSVSNDGITMNEVAYLRFEESCYIKDYGEVSIAKLHLNNNAPSVLFRNFLLIINHDKKEISEFNVDQFYPARIRPEDSTVNICAINNFRGNLEFLMIKYCNKNLKQTNYIKLFLTTDCHQYKPGSLLLVNKKDINKYGFLNLHFIFTVISYCDMNGGPFPKPISKEKKEIKLILQKGSDIYIRGSK